MTGDESDDDDGAPTDMEIARATETRPIADVAGDLGLSRDDLDPQGDGIAKIEQDAIQRTLSDADEGKLILVTGTTATPKGAGKTVTTVGLGQGIDHIGENGVVAVREPSLGPVFGIKGGAAGGGHSQVLPMEDINLHFTGDLHALTTAHNLVSATLDTKIHYGNDLDVDVDEVSWERALDMNDRALRDVVVGLGGSSNGPPREEGFQITAASEVMAVLCLADSLADLKERLSRTIVAYDSTGEPVTVADLGIEGAMAMLLKDALRPNLVQTIEGTPAFVHGGPFANIAHGTNSLVADKLGLALGDYLVTEAGFAADLGFEKFGNIVSRHGVAPDATVLTTAVRSMKYHGKDMWPVDYDELKEPDPDAVRAGMTNLDHHAGIIEQFGVPFVVAVNRFPTDTDAEIQAIVDHCEREGYPVVVSNAFAEGGAGAAELAETATDLADSDRGNFQPLYDTDESLTEKIRTVATEVYGAADVHFTDDARDDLERLDEQGYGDMPVCLSKTQHSTTDDPTRKGAPALDWTLTVRECYPDAGAGFVVVLTGDVLTMPGLPETPAAEGMDVDEDGNISGLF
ncbi:formate--tetrahydrofolate ligase [Haloplanus pelagicus]|uniref:formate--tetrahydrofolate ligase n=1 Tax=Haloplanus pelagicus TaxID=2949995 RepID=UPI0020404E98|nr:formate--tetrahydrofolate ligase [Haloplanus sp. HW8-1]